MRFPTAVTSIAVIVFALVIRCDYIDAVRPAVSDSVLFQMLEGVWKATGVALSGNKSEDRIMVMNRKHSNKCLDLFRGNHTNFNYVIRYNCKERSNNQMLWIRHAGFGYVSIVFEPNLCAGSGYDVGSKLHVTLGDEWCKYSQSHRFAMIVVGNYVQFEQAENGLCITSPDSGEDVYVDHCIKGDQRQHWTLWEPNLKKFWPNPAA